jgi:hypothetical protein
MDCRATEKEEEEDDDDDNDDYEKSVAHNTMQVEFISLFRTIHCTNVTKRYHM